MNYQVNDVIYYPVPGAIYKRIENTVLTKVKITHLYHNINSMNGIIADMEMLELQPGKHITGKLLNSRNYLARN